MPAGGPLLTFEAFGLVGALATDGSEPVDALLEALPPGWRPAPGKRPSVRFELTGDGAVLADGAVAAPPAPERRFAVEALGRTIQHHLAEHAPEYVFVHAGVVAVGNIGVLVPGRSLSGKTTLVAALVELGATYYSDEYAAIDTRGGVHPYARPLVLRWDSRSEKRQVPVEVPSERVGSEPVTAGLIVVTQHRSGVSWEPSRAAAGAGALALVDNAVAARRRPHAVMAAARHVAAGATVLVGDRGDAREAAQAIMIRVDAQAGARVRVTNPTS